MKKKAVVIGSGFGGLSMAIRLQAAGFETSIYEKNNKIGGHASQFKKNGYTFDMGPSIVTLPFLFEELFELNNEKFTDYIDLELVDPFYRIYYHDKTFIDYSGDEEDMKKQIAKYNEDDSIAYDKFMNYSKNLYKLVIEDGMGQKPFNSWKDFFAFLPQGIAKKALLPGYFAVSRYFKDFRTKFLFSFHPLFIGGNPFITPSILLMLPYLEKKKGVWFAKGGMYRIIEELGALFERMGGKIYTNSEVESIEIENKKVKAIVVNGTTINIDLIVSNAHFAHTYKDLIDEKYRKKFTDKKIEKMSYSMSSYLLYLGVTKKYDQLLHHTLILSERYKELVQDIFKHKILAEDFSIYLHAPTKSDPEMAPENCESLYLLIPVPNLSTDIDWKNIEPEYTKKVLAFLEDDFGLKDLRKNIEVQETFLPPDFEDVRNNYLGACWSLEPKITQIANLRPHNKSEEFENLYLVGASTHPGGGVPGVILSAKATEQSVKKDFGL